MWGLFDSLCLDYSIEEALGIFDSEGEAEAYLDEMDDADSAGIYVHPIEDSNEE